MADPAPLPLDEHLCFTLYGAGIAINRTYKPMLDEFGITYPQYLVLNALWESGSLTIGALAARLALESSTITPLVKRLELNGFVERQRSVADERQVHVSVTQQGRDLQRKTSCLTETLGSRSGMTAEELAILNAQVRRLRDALQESAARAGL